MRGDRDALRRGYQLDPSPHEEQDRPHGGEREGAGQPCAARRLVGVQRRFRTIVSIIQQTMPRLRSISSAFEHSGLRSAKRLASTPCAVGVIPSRVVGLPFLLIWSIHCCLLLLKTVGAPSCLFFFFSDRCREGPPV